MGVTFNTAYNFNKSLNNTNAVLLIAVPSGATATMQKNGIIRTPIFWLDNDDNTVTYAIFIIQQSTFDSNPWTINVITTDLTITTTIVIDSAKEYELVLLGGVPDFTYTGTYYVVDDEGNTIPQEDYSSTLDWNIYFLSDGTLTLNRLFCSAVDICAVGGGGGGGGGAYYLHSSNAYFSFQHAGGSGGGGTIVTEYNKSISTGTFTVDIGAGGNHGSTSKTQSGNGSAGSAGQTTSISNSVISASGGGGGTAGTAYSTGHAGSTGSPSSTAARAFNTDTYPLCGGANTSNYGGGGRYGSATWKTYSFVVTESTNGQSGIVIMRNARN